MTTTTTTTTTSTSTSTRLVRTIISTIIISCFVSIGIIDSNHEFVKYAPSQDEQDVVGKRGYAYQYLRGLRDLRCDSCGDDTASNNNGACFSSTTKVFTSDHEWITMKDLKVGQYIQTTSSTSSTNKKNGFEPVYTFGQYNTNSETKFLKVYTKGGSGSTKEPLEITPDHLIYVKGYKHPIAARGIQVGDYLLTASTTTTGTSTSTTTSTSISKYIKVTKIQTITRNDGYYAPLTPSGNIMVNRNGIIASTYATPAQPNSIEYVEFGSDNNLISSGLSQHFVAHLIISPMRMMCLGIATQLCEPSTIPNDPQNTGAGRPAIVIVLEDIAIYARDSLPIILQAIVLFGIVTSLGCFYIVEIMFGPIISPWILFGTCAYMMTKYNNNKQQKKKNHNEITKEKVA